MEENLKLYSNRAISITTFFGGPLAAGILIRRNYLNLGKEKQGLNALFIGIITTVLLFLVLFIIPDHEAAKIPNQLIPFIYTGIIYFLVEKLMGNELRNHKENNGEFYSAWKAARIGFVSLLIILFSIASVAFFAGDFQKPKNFDVEAYNSGFNRFLKNEETSLDVFNLLGTVPVEKQNMELNKSIALWKENKMIIGQLNQIENLPDELIDQNNLMSRYCELRIVHFGLIQKAITENSRAYDQQIINVGQEIERLIDSENLSNP